MLRRETTAEIVRRAIQIHTSDKTEHAELGQQRRHVWLCCRGHSIDGTPAHVTVRGTSLRRPGWCKRSPANGVECMAAASCVFLDGYFDSARHAPRALTAYRSWPGKPELTIGNWKPITVFVNDLRVSAASAASPTDRECASADACVSRAVQALRSGLRDAELVLVMAPGGLEGRPHTVGGGWVAPGCGVTFYVARNPCTGCMFLCADVGVRAV